MSNNPKIQTLMVEVRQIVDTNQMIMQPKYVRR